MGDANAGVSRTEGEHDDIVYPAAIPFVLVHLTCIAAIWTGITWPAVAIGVALYWLRIFAIGAGYHRYFSHRAYATSRIAQFVLAALAQSTAQRSVLWWAAKHHATDLVKIADFARYPELMWLHRHEWVPAIILAVLCLLIGGWPGLIVGFFWSTVLVYHATFCINSLAHVWGKKRYVTGDDSRNNWFLATFTMGEGWHNNHHAYQSSVRQGFRWWELDPTYYVLKVLSWIGLVWDLKSPPAAVLRNEHRLGSRVISRAAAQLAESFQPDRIAAAIGMALDGSSLSALREKLSETQHRAANVLANLHLPDLPTRNEVLSRATAMFARTPSIDDIVDQAHALLLDAIGARLCPVRA